MLNRCFRILFQILFFLGISLLLPVPATGEFVRPQANKRNSSKLKKLLYLPLDERFTTRDLFLSFAEITPYRVITPEKSSLPQKKNLPDVEALIDWTARAAARTDAAIISADMLLYGGLIASRTSGESLEAVRARLKVLKEIRARNPRLPIFVSTTVMRMPQYSSSDEEPDYYAQYGREIFLYSQYSHRFETSQNAEDAANAELYENKIPNEVSADYRTRRARNFQINKDLIELVKTGVINRLVITLDDNHEYGWNIKEAAELKRLSAGLTARVAVYPGADEAQLPLLARLALGGKMMRVFIAYRFPEAKKLIPAFEGQPLDESVEQQISAAGGSVAGSQSEAECVLYVNNFAEKQLFAGSQIAAEEKTVKEEQEKVPLEVLFAESRIKIDAKKTYILADNRYYNGADARFISSIFASRINPLQIAYAGWNTSGNTLGTTLAMGLLRQRTKNDKSARKSYEKMLWARFIEDWAYMVDGREDIKKDLKRRNINGFAGTNLETEYERQITTLLNSKAAIVNRFLKTDYRVARAYFPWHRHFEIGFEISNVSAK